MMFWGRMGVYSNVCITLGVHSGREEKSMTRKTCKCDHPPRDATESVQDLERGLGLMGYHQRLRPLISQALLVRLLN